jgi:hypothetical protein
MSIKSPLSRQFGSRFDSVFDVVKSNPVYDKAGGSIPSLDLNFAKSKSLLDGRSTKNKITFTRASSGTYVGSDGLIKTAASGEARFDHDPETGESLGLLVEESRTNLLISSEDLSGFNKAHATTPFDSSVVNPTGLTGSYKILADSGLSTVGVRIRKTTNSGNNIVVSAFVKKSTYRYVLVGFGGTGNSFTALFDIEPGLTSNRLLGQGGKGTFTNIDAGYQNLPNNWIRIWAVGTTTGIEGPTLGMGPDATTFNITNWTTAGTEEIYAWGLQYEDNVSFPTSYIPTEGSTVTRAADVASISGSNFGAFRTNLLRYSEEFGDAYWPKVRCSVIPNATLAPNNTFTADAIVEDISNNTHILQADGGTNPVGGKTYTYSWHLKSGERTALRIAFGFDNGVWQGETVDIDLSNGILSNVSGFTTPPTVENVGNGWYRLSTTATAQASANGVLRMTPLVGGSASYTGDGTSKYFIWGSQLEEGSTATNYIKSDVNFVSRASSATYYDANGAIQTAAVDEARTAAYLPDGNGNFVSAGPLLLEDAGTNLLLQSNQFDTTWASSNSSETAAAGIAPDGTNTAWEFKDTNDVSATVHNLNQGVSGVSGLDYTYSVYAKAGTLPELILTFPSAIFGGTITTRFDVLNGTILQAGNGTTNSITNVGGGWYRLAATLLSTASATGSYQLRLGNGSGASYVGDGNGTVYIWGAQVEQSSYATSYIPTTTSTATRAADVSTSSATTVFESDWYRQDEGTVFVNQTSLSTVPQDFATVFQFKDATATNVLFTRKRPGFSQWVASGENSLFMTRTISQPSVLSVAYKTDDAAFAAEGTLTNDNSCTIDPNKVEVLIGSGIGSASYMNGTISRFTYWPTRLPDSTLQTITQ